MPSFALENAYQGPVVGFDEAGRGPLAGPVVAACVYIATPHDFLNDVRDSKKLTAHKRDALFNHITRHCAFGIAIAEPDEIDRLNILQATFLAMARAQQSMEMAFGITAHTCLVDGSVKPRTLQSPHIVTVIKGDDLSYSIACASILAKVTRDRLMHALHSDYPHYGWDNNSGYPTAGHVAALNIHGPSPHHRTSFAPVRQAIEKTRKSA